jgi:hypothetical protein
MNRRLCLILLGLGSATFLVGCGSRSQSAETESSNLKPLAVYYGRFVGANRGRGPKDENELKEFIKTQPAAELEKMGAKDVDSLFVSSRDKKPYKFKFESKPSAPGQSSTIFAWEQDGVGGKRFVGGTLGEVKEVGEEEFRTLVPNP